MDDIRFDALLRSLTVTPSRRHAVPLLIGSALGSLFSLGILDAGAHDALKKCKKIEDKQKRKKCEKKAKTHNSTHNLAPPPPPPPPAPPTCEESCPSSCLFCMHPVDGGPFICGDSATSSGCSPACTSHSDCVGKAHPYCITGFTVRADETDSSFCGGAGTCMSVGAC